MGLKEDFMEVLLTGVTAAGLTYLSPPAGALMVLWMIADFSAKDLVRKKMRQWK